MLRPEQRRKLSTTILRNRSQPQVIGGVRRVVPTQYYIILYYYYQIHLNYYLHILGNNYLSLFVCGTYGSELPFLKTILIYSFFYFSYLKLNFIFKHLINVYYFLIVIDNGHITLRHLLNIHQKYEHNTVSEVGHGIERK